MRKTLGKILSTAVLVVSAGATSAYAADDTFVASVTIDEALEISCTDLNFGTVLRSGSYAGGQSVYFDPSTGTIGSGTGLTLAGGHSRAACTVSGVDGGDATIVLSDGSGTWNTTANLLQTNLKLSGQTDIIAEIVPSKVSSVGNGTFYIGGSVFVPTLSSNTVGTYSSNPITVTLTD